MAQNNSQVAAGAAGAAGAGPANQQAPRGRIVFLNALPLNALPRRHLALDVVPVSLNDLAAWVQRRIAEGYTIEHYIRHGATVETLRALGIPLNPQPNSGLYSYREGDIIVVVTLRSPARGQDVSQVRPEDLESWIVTVL
jgi:hypothetical protein